MRSKFAIAGHPIHPMLVGIPIGLFVWALICDIVYVANGKDRLWYDMSFWAGTAAWITALIAALPGLGDLITVAIKSDAREMALTHMGINVTIVAAFFVAMLLMRHAAALEGGRLTAVVILHAVGAGLLLLSGWLGGEMVFRHHLGIIADDGQMEASEISRHAGPGVGHPTRI